uniref:Replication protein A 70 kDa DNA-binding subunit B/D first OB fold domain-containing protein n=1 Tax=Brassica oleracea var. oleracea TaxID=109376 RepID=A0A0D3AQH6_BRAOL
MAANFDQVSELEPFKMMWKIRVKIIRLWRQYSAKGGETIEMALLDYSGDKIHATVKKDLVSHFEPFLKEGESRIFQTFSLTHSSDIIGQVVEVSDVEIMFINGKKHRKVFMCVTE